MRELVLGTRGSTLALWQADFVKSKLELMGVRSTIKVIKTSGDTVSDLNVRNAVGRGLFIKELEEALIDKEIDFAVHSLKDVPVGLPDNLVVAAITKRDDPRDCILSMNYDGMQGLFSNYPFSTGCGFSGVKIGTSSPRRFMQLKIMNPGLSFCNLRGNVHTRVSKLKEGEYDAIVMAHIAVRRMNLQSMVNFVKVFEVSEVVPPMGQGSLALECRDPRFSSSSFDLDVYNVLSSLDDKKSSLCCNTERHFISLLGGGCQAPVGVHARFLSSGKMELMAVVGDLQARTVLRGCMSFDANKSGDKVKEMVNRFIQGGAASVLAT